MRSIFFISFDNRLTLHESGRFKNIAIRFCVWHRRAAIQAQPGEAGQESCLLTAGPVALLSNCVTLRPACGPASCFGHFSVTVSL